MERERLFDETRQKRTSKEDVLQTFDLPGATVKGRLGELVDTNERRTAAPSSRASNRRGARQPSRPTTSTPSFNARIKEAAPQLYSALTEVARQADALQGEYEEYVASSTADEPFLKSLSQIAQYARNADDSTVSRNTRQRYRTIAKQRFNALSTRISRAVPTLDLKALAESVLWSGGPFGPPPPRLPWSVSRRLLKADRIEITSERRLLVERCNPVIVPGTKYNVATTKGTGAIDLDAVDHALSICSLPVLPMRERVDVPNNAPTFKAQYEEDDALLCIDTRALAKHIARAVAYDGEFANDRAALRDDDGNPITDPARVETLVLQLMRNFHPEPFAQQQWENGDFSGPVGFNANGNDDVSEVPAFDPDDPTTYRRNRDAPTGRMTLYNLSASTLSMPQFLSTLANRVKHPGYDLYPTLCRPYLTWNDLFVACTWYASYADFLELLPQLNDYQKQALSKAGEFLYPTRVRDDTTRNPFSYYRRYAWYQMPRSVAVQFSRISESLFNIAMSLLIVDWINVLLCFLVKYLTTFNMFSDWAEFSTLIELVVGRLLVDTYQGLRDSWVKASALVNNGFGANFNETFEAWVKGKDGLLSGVLLSAMFSGLGVVSNVVSDLFGGEELLKFVLRAITATYKNLGKLVGDEDVLLEFFAWSKTVNAAASQIPGGWMIGLVGTQLANKALLNAPKYINIGVRARLLVELYRMASASSVWTRTGQGLSAVIVLLSAGNFCSALGLSETSKTGRGCRYVTDFLARTGATYLLCQSVIRLILNVYYSFLAPDTWWRPDGQITCLRPLEKVCSASYNPNFPYPTTPMPPPPPGT